MKCIDVQKENRFSEVQLNCLKVQNPQLTEQMGAAAPLTALNVRTAGAEHLYLGKNSVEGEKRVGEGVLPTWVVQSGV